MPKRVMGWEEETEQSFISWRPSGTKKHREDVGPLKDLLEEGSFGLKLQKLTQRMAAIPPPTQHILHLLCMGERFVLKQWHSKWGHETTSGGSQVGCCHHFSFN